MSGHSVCKICKVTISIDDQQAHLSSTYHTTRVAKEPPKKLKPKTWACEICDITVSMDGVETHRAGKRHRKLMASNTQNEIQPTPIAAAESTPINPAVRHGGPTTKVEPKPIPAYQKGPSKFAAKRLIANLDERRPTWWTCARCGITMYADRREPHENGKCTGTRPASTKFEPAAAVGGSIYAGGIEASIKPAAVRTGLQRRLDNRQKTMEQGRDNHIARQRTKRTSGKGSFSEWDSE